MVIMYVHKVDSSTDKRVMMAGMWVRVDMAAMCGGDKNEDIIDKCTYDHYRMPVW